MDIYGQLVLDALEMTIEQRGIRCSTSKGNCHDNAVAESFFHALNEELVTDDNYKTKNEARQSVVKYIELFYNW